MKKQWLLSFSVLLGLCSSALGGGLHELDLRFLETDSATRDVISRHIPTEIAASLDTTRVAESLPSMIHIANFVGYDSVVDTAVLIVHITDGMGLAVIQLFRRIGGYWHFVSQCMDVAGSSVSTLNFLDLNCDQLNEVVVTSPVGASAREWIDIIAIRDDSLVNITKELFRTRLTGRRISIDMIGDCDLKVRVAEEGLKRNVITSIKTYEFDSQSRSFKLVSHEKLD